MADKPYGVPVRGQVEAAFGAGATNAVQLFDFDGNLRTLGADERLDITDVSYRAGTASNLHVFYDTLGDGSFAQNAGPTLAHSGSGSSIGAGTYSLAITYFDPFTNSETPLSALVNVTPLANETITVTAPVAIPAYMTGRDGSRGFIKVYRSDGGGTGFVAQSAAGTNSVILSSVAVSGSLPTSGANGSGKVIGTTFLSANAPWSDCFETGKIGPPGVGVKVTSSAAATVAVEISGRIIKNTQLP